MVASHGAARQRIHFSPITVDVRACLIRTDYFEKLDGILSPEDGSTLVQSCDGTFRFSEAILFASGFDRRDIDDILAVLESKGACCDCVPYKMVDGKNTNSLFTERNRSSAGGRKK